VEDAAALPDSWPEAAVTNVVHLPLGSGDRERPRGARGLLGGSNKRPASTRAGELSQARRHGWPCLLCWLELLGCFKLWPGSHHGLCRIRNHF